jgi:biopolymer transport protein TolQ
MFLQQFCAGQNTERLRTIADSNLAKIFNSAITRLEQLETTKLDLNARLESAAERMQTTIEKQQQELESGTATLATIGSISPYVGLFGTVWGILNTFSHLGNMGGATLSQVAPGIAEALIATAFGLLVAIPAVIAYNKLNTQINNLGTEAEHFAADLYATLQRQLYSSKEAPCNENV